MEIKTLELDATTQKFFVGVLSQCRTVFNSYDESGLAEPWLSHYRKIKSDYDTALKELAPSDQAVASLDAHRHLGCLYSMLAGANSMCSMLMNNMADMKKGAMNALNSAVDAAVAKRIADGDLLVKTEVDNRVKTAVDAEIVNRTKTGDLIPKEQHQQFCSAAKDLGLKEGKTVAETAAAAERTQQETVNKRKTLLATNGMPLPTKDVDKILSGTDAEFETRQTTAKSRMENLMSKGVVLNSDHQLWHNIWLDEESYKTFEALAASMAGGEPFAGGARNSAPPSGAMLL